MEIEITTEPVERKVEPVGKSSFVKIEQEGWLFDGISQYPLPLKLEYGDRAERLQVGKRYRMTLKSFKVGQYGRLELNGWDHGLVQVDQAKALKAA